MPLPDLSTILQLSPEELAPQLLATLKEKWPRPGERISLGYIVSNLDRPVARCVAEAWSALETGGLIAMDPEDNNVYWYFITRRGEAANTDVEVNVALAMASTRRDAWHLALRTTVYTKYVRGDYDAAVLEALALLEAEVKGMTDQQALVGLFAGAVGSSGKSSGVRLVPYDADTCREVLGFASFLLRLADAGKKVAADGGRN